MKKYIWPLVFLCLCFFGCGDEYRPFPEVSVSTDPVDSGYILPDGSFTTTLPDVSPASVPRIPATDNAYICYCRFEVPMNCVQPGCGTITTGTNVTPDNFVMLALEK